MATSGGGSAFATAAGGGSATGSSSKTPEVWSQPATPLPTTMAVRIAYYGMVTTTGTEAKRGEPLNLLSIELDAMR